MIFSGKYIFCLTFYKRKPYFRQKNYVKTGFDASAFYILTKKAVKSNIIDNCAYWYFLLPGKFLKMFLRTLTNRVKNISRQSEELNNFSLTQAL